MTSSSTCHTARRTSAWTGAGKCTQTWRGRTRTASPRRISAGGAGPGGLAASRGRASWWLLARRELSRRTDGEDRGASWLNIGLLWSASGALGQRRYYCQEVVHCRYREPAPGWCCHSPAETRRRQRDEPFHARLEPYHAGPPQPRLGANLEQRQGQAVERMRRLGHLHGADRLNTPLQRGGLWSTTGSQSTTCWRTASTCCSRMPATS